LELAPGGAWNCRRRPHGPSRCVPLLLPDTPNPPASWGACGFGVSEEVWTRSQSTRTAAQLPFEVALLEAVGPPVYQLIAARADQLSRLGLTNVQVA